MMQRPPPSRRKRRKRSPPQSVRAHGSRSVHSRLQQLLTDVRVSAGFQLHTERLAHERDDCRRQKEEQESRQCLKSQQKLLGKKKTEEFACIRLIRPQDRVTRQRNLHQNGIPASPKAQAHVGGKQRQSRHLDAQRTRPILSARERMNEEPLPAAALRRPRPQSAKPVLQSYGESGGSSSASRASEIVSGTKISVRRLENCGYNPVSLTSHLLESQSATQLRMPRHSLRHRISSSVTRDPDKSHKQALPSSTSGTIADGSAISSSNNRQRIVVYMQRLELSDSESDDEAQLEPLHRECSAKTSAWA